MNRSPLGTSLNGQAERLEIDVAKRSWLFYPEYQQTAIPWLGAVPSHWEVRRLKSALVRNDGGAWGEDFDPNGTVVLRSTEQAVDGRWIIDDPARRLLSMKEQSAALLLEGDLVITKSSGSALHIGKTSLVDKTVESLGCCFSNFMQRLRCDARTEPRFVHYLLNSPVGREQFGFASNTTTGLANLNGGMIGNLRVAWPPLDEQQSIATFLDRKTRQIDELIETKQQLITLLHEQRTALISHAVTKGLNPDAPMKPSGVLWLGDVPAHWEVKRVKHVSRIRYGLGEPPARLPDGLPFIRATDIYRGTIDLSDVQRVDPRDIPWSRRPALESGEILVVRSGAYTGDSALVTKEMVGSIAGYDMVVTPFAAVPEFIALCFLSRPVLHGQIMLARSRAAQPHLNAEELGNIVFACPPSEEQAEIAEYLDKRLADLQEVCDRIDRIRDRLVEYRQTVVSAAVTGRIDVRRDVRL